MASTPTRHWWRAAPIGALVLLAAGCSSTPSDFKDRATLSQCPAEELKPTDPTISLAGIDCLTQQGQQEGAELEVVRYTTEGDPITYYYRKTPDAPGFEIFIDSTKDSYGAGGWTRMQCPDGTDINNPTECEEQSL